MSRSKIYRIPRRGGHICVIYAAHARAGGRPAPAGAAVTAPLSNNATVAARLVFRVGRLVFRDRCMPYDVTLGFIGRESGGMKEGERGWGDCDRIFCGN